MKVVIKKVNENPVLTYINGDLKEMQEIVGGYIETFPVYDNILCVCNENGKLMGLRPNFKFGFDTIVGNVFFVAAGYEDFESLSDKQATAIIETFTNLK